MGYQGLAVPQGAIEFNYFLIWELRLWQRIGGEAMIGGEAKIGGEAMMG